MSNLARDSQVARAEITQTGLTNSEGDWLVPFSICAQSIARLPTQASQARLVPAGSLQSDGIWALCHCRQIEVIAVSVLSDLHYLLC